MKKLLKYLCVLLPVAAYAQKKPADSGIVYYTLGSDTTVIQYFEISNDRFRTSFIQFTGAITKCEASGQLDTEGNLKEVRSSNYRIGSGNKWELTTTGVNTFNGDSTLYIASNPAGQMVNRRSFPGQGILANGMDIASFYVFPYMGFYAPEKNGGILIHRQLSFNGYRSFTVARLSPGELRIGSNLMGNLELYTDKEGRMQKIEGTGSSLNIKATVDRNRINPALLDQVAIRRYAAGAVAVRTLRDTARVQLDKQTIEVDYWQPHKRDREIFGNVVPWNRIWRMGANNATQLRISADIILGEYRLPKGIYGLWCFPTRDHWDLIVNENANAWGTDHDMAKDVIRLPFVVERLEEPVEVLKIRFDKKNEKEALMVLTWDTYQASIRVRIE